MELQLYQIHSVLAICNDGNKRSFLAKGTEIGTDKWHTKGKTKPETSKLECNNLDDVHTPHSKNWNFEIVNVSSIV